MYKINKVSRMSAKIRNVCVSDGRMMRTCGNERATEYDPNALAPSGIPDFPLDGKKLEATELSRSCVTIVYAICTMP